MFVMDQITNVQFARIIFIAPQFVTGQVGTTVMIQPHETEKKIKKLPSNDIVRRKKLLTAGPFNFSFYNLSFSIHLMASCSFVSRLSGYN